MPTRGALTLLEPGKGYAASLKMSSRRRGNTVQATTGSPWCGRRRRHHCVVVAVEAVHLRRVDLDLAAGEDELELGAEEEELDLVGRGG
jgi:hypothetical protein